MSRLEEITNLIPEDSQDLVKDVIDQIIFLEAKLDELKKLPFIQVHPDDPMLQRATPASKQYKEFLQQYINCVKVIEGIIYRDKRLDNEDAEESPLRKWFNTYGNDGK